MATGLELPAAIIGIAGVVGVADVAVKGVSTVYTRIRELHDVPEEVHAIRLEINALDQAVNALTFLKSADPSIQTILRQSVLPQSLIHCGEACGELEKDLQQWTKDGEYKLRSKLKVKANKAKIEKYLAEIRRASQFVVLAQGSVLLAVVVTNQSDTAIQEFRAKTEEVANKAKLDHQRVQEEQRALKDKLADELDDLAEIDIQAALEEKVKEEDVYKDVMAQSAVAAIGVVQKIGTVKAGDLTKIQVGMPADVVDKVKEQTIGNVTIGDNADAKIGIFTR